MGAKQRVVIVGAGIGGLSAAIRLQSAGYSVQVYEKQPQVGGKMYEIRQDGFRFDTGPSVITMRHVLDDLFTSVGHSLSDYLTLLPIDPLTRYFYPNGTRLDLTRDLPALLEQIESLDERDVAGYLRYLAYAAEINRIAGPVFIYDHPPQLSSFARVPVTEWLKADPFRTMYGSIRRFVKSPELRQLLGRFATYVGASPYRAPATLNVIAHVELNGGVWYPQGGIYRIAEALLQLANSLGVEIITGTGVEKIRVQNGAVKGVILSDNRTVNAQVVLSNVDVATTYDHLLEDHVIPAARRTAVTHYEPSCSGFIMMLGVDRQFNEATHHNIWFSSDYRAEFDAIFSQQRPADEPTIYAAITSKTDADHAPEGCENWFILVNAPALSERFTWDEAAINDYRMLVLNRLKQQGFDLKPHIISETIWTPVDLERMSGAWRGALYGPSGNRRLTAFRRPNNRSADVNGLYFVGGTTHPGGGVPMVILSGKVASEMIVEDNPLGS